MPSEATHADCLHVESASVDVQMLCAVGMIPGVAMLFAAGRNGPGAGRLRYDGDGTLQYKAPGSATWGIPVPVPADGNYVVEDGDDQSCYLRVAVYVAHLAATHCEARILLGDVYENEISHDDVTAAEASAGDVTSYSVTLYNAGLRVLSQIKVWIDASVSGLKISDDDATWVNPTSEATALELPDLAAGASDTLYIQRTIGAASGEDVGVLNHVHISFCGL